MLRTDKIDIHNWFSHLISCVECVRQIQNYGNMHVNEMMQRCVNIYESCKIFQLCHKSKIFDTSIRRHNILLHCDQPFLAVTWRKGWDYDYKMELNWNQIWLILHSKKVMQVMPYTRLTMHCSLKFHASYHLNPDKKLSKESKRL